MKHIKKLLGIGMVMLMLFACSEDDNHYSPDQVIKNTLEKTRELESYYAEIEMVTKEAGEVIDEMKMKEWQGKDGKSRIETANPDGRDENIAVNDGNQVTTYIVDKNEAFIIDEMEEINQQQSLKEQIHFYLNNIRKTHKIEVVGEEKVAGRDAQHFIATPKETGTLIGKQEGWIDQETWLLLKMTMMMGDTGVEMNYTKVEIDPDMSEDLFELDLPEDVIIQDVEDSFENEIIDLTEVPESIGRDVLYLPEKDGLGISRVEKTELKGEIERTEVQIDYEKDGKPYFSLFLFETPDSEEDMDLFDEEAIEIRGEEGSLYEDSFMRLLSWQEDGISYSVDLEDEELRIEDFLDLAEEMEYMK